MERIMTRWSARLFGRYWRIWALLLFGLLLLCLRPSPAWADGPLDDVIFVSFDEKYSCSVAWGDVDGDGDLDLAIGNMEDWGSEPALSQLYRNNGSGGFTVENLEVVEHDTRSLAWGDYDGDGDLDLAIGNAGVSSGEVNQVYRNEGGIFVPAWTSTGDIKETMSVAWGDVDGDGDLDLAVGNSGDVNRLYLNNGNGGFTIDDLGSVISDTQSVTWGDVDGDGDLDLAVGNQGHNHLYRNDSAGGIVTLTLAYTSPESDTTKSVAWGDADGDGKLDLAVGNHGANRLYRNDSSVGTIALALIYTAPETMNTDSVAWGDVEGDGDLDLAVGIATSNRTNQLYRNDGSGNFGIEALGTDKKATCSVAWGDADGDGDLDLATGGSGQVNQVYRNDGEVGFVVNQQGASGRRTRSMAWGDADGDGDLDIAVGNDNSVVETNRLYRNDGDGNFTLQDIGTIVSNTRSIAWGDYDQDGDLDLAVGNFGEANQLYDNDGSGSFTASDLGTAISNTRSVAWGDVDGDGDLDLAVGNGEGSAEQNQLYRNNGAGGFTVENLGDGAKKTTSIAWGDADGDGDLDLAVGNWRQANQLYRNDGNGNFTVEELGTGIRRPTSSVAWGDADGDGDLDLAVGNQENINQLYRNDGNGNFGAENLGTDTKSTAGIAWGDVDGDGDMDMAVGNRWVVNQLYHNDGNGYFSTEDLGTDAHDTLGIAWGDADGDGDLDLAIGNNGFNYVYANARQGGQALVNNAPSIKVTALYTSAANFYAASTVLDDPTIPISYTIFDPENDLVGRIEAFYSSDGGGHWLPAVPTTDTIVTNLMVSSPGITLTHIYTWDTFASGFFGKSDNVVFRLDAYLVASAGKDNITGTHRYTHTVPGPYQRPYVTAQTFPFRVRGNQVRVMRGVAPIADAMVYRLPSGQLTGAEPYARNTGEPFRTNDLGYLQGHGQINPGDHLIALLPTVPVASASCTTFSHTVSIDVPGDQVATINSLLDVSDIGTIVDVNVTLSGTHTWIGDLAFTLQSPSETAVEIMEASCGSTDNFNLTLDDEAMDIWPCPPTDGQAYLPSNPLSAFDGEDGEGVWILSIVDTYPADGGRLDTWSLEICSVEDTAKYDLYYTNITPTLTGLDSYTVTQAGVQTLTVSADNPLLLFNLDVSLEWDARKDVAFLDQLDVNLHRVSERLFDASNGQAALGNVTIYHDKINWNNADIQVYASNALIPNADVGGIVTQDKQEQITVNPFAIPAQTLPYTITYRAGKVRMGAVWRRYEGSGGEQTDDWPRALVHELGHYLFYLYDNYLGLNNAGVVIPVATCGGSLMSNSYSTDEYRNSDGWATECATTMSARRSGRADWDTITTFYPQLSATTVNTGPAALPLAVTQIVEVQLVDEDFPLEEFVFTLTDEHGAIFQPGPHAQAILYQEGRIVDLGRPDINKVYARGAREGDRLCVYELDAQPPRLGCETLTPNDNYLIVAGRENWQPEVLVTPVSSASIKVDVNAVPTGLNLYGRLYPGHGGATDALTLTPTAEGYQVFFTLTEPDVKGYIHIWVDEPDITSLPRREVVTSYALGGNPDCEDDCPPGGRAPTESCSETEKESFIPAISPDGQVLLYGNVAFADGEFYALQKATLLPDPLPWATVVGEGYHVLRSSGAPTLTGTSINFRYREQDVPPGEEDFLSIYYWNDTKWENLPTVRNPDSNEVSALSRGAGLYALMSSLEIPMPVAGWNMIAYPVQETRTVTDVLKSIEGYYGLVYGYDPADAGAPWKVYKPNSVPPWVNDLHEMEFGKGYWISATQPITWEVKGGSDARAPQSANNMGPPATYYGVVSPSATFVPVAGMTVSVYVEGKLCGRGETLSVGGDIVYSVKVGYTPAGGACGDLGQIVTFRVGSTMMSTTAEWNNNDVWELPLSPAAAPTISDIADQSTKISTPITVTFTISDAETAPDSLGLSATSSNTELVTTTNIVFEGSGMTRTATITPTAGMTGTTTITITVDDGELDVSDSFTLTVEAGTVINTAPTISDIADQSTKVNTPITVTFTISDAKTAPGDLWLYAESFNLSLVNGGLNGTLMSGGGISFGGSGVTRTATITPTDGVTGTTTITVTVNDGEIENYDSFVLTVVEEFCIYLPVILKN
ncbi:MAG: hypothetical protein GY832_10130 [Chloroflexi bacterium]|nr:hypothetical protein [Chloroflexota bacterium]